MSLTSRTSTPPSAREKAQASLVDLVDMPRSAFFFSMLPAKIQDRIPRLPSLRNRPALPRRPSRPPPPALDANSHRRSMSLAPSAGVASTTATSSGAETPPPAYAPDRSGGSPPRALTRYNEELSLCLLDDPNGWKEDRPSSADSRASGRHADTRTGIAWKFANQGLNLLGLSVEESHGLHDDAAEEEAMLGRQLYIHAVTYLLRGLPSDLSPEEQLGVRAALPAGVVEPLRLEINARQQVIGPGHPSRHSTQPAPPSILHRTLASTIVQFFLLCQFLLPYIRGLLRSAYNYERTHRVSEKILAASIDTVDTLGKRGLEVGSAVARLGDGKLGQAVNGLAAWWLEGVAGGICDGVGEGLILLGLPRLPSPGPGLAAGMEGRAW
ncbi:MAG: hypothetical protein M1838_000372 [Thelocarpon superellum]|nr:MAG: hypothetical protein M1838_000372 [Thelocarpon superellum]